MLGAQKEWKEAPEAAILDFWEVEWFVWI